MDGIQTVEGGEGSWQNLRLPSPLNGKGIPFMDGGFGCSRRFGAGYWLRGLDEEVTEAEGEEQVEHHDRPAHRAQQASDFAR